MGTFGDEFINMDLPIRGGDPSVFLIPDRRDSTALDNTNKMIQAITRLGAAGGYLMFPPGRYYLGTPTLPLTERMREFVAGADLVVPPQVTLLFMPGAQLVPLSYAPGQGERTRFPVELNDGR